MFPFTLKCAEENKYTKFILKFCGNGTGKKDTQREGSIFLIFLCLLLCLLQSIV